MTQTIERTEQAALVRERDAALYAAKVFEEALQSLNGDAAKAAWSNAEAALAKFEREQTTTPQADPVQACSCGREATEEFYSRWFCPEHLEANKAAYRKGRQEGARECAAMVPVPSRPEPESANINSDGPACFAGECPKRLDLRPCAEDAFADEEDPIQAALDAKAERGYQELANWDNAPLATEAEMEELYQAVRERVDLSPPCILPGCSGHTVEQHQMMEEDDDREPERR